MAQATGLEIVLYFRLSMDQQMEQAPHYQNSTHHIFNEMPLHSAQHIHRQRAELDKTIPFWILSWVGWTLSLI